MSKWYEKVISKVLTASLMVFMLAVCCGILKISFIIFRWCIYGMWG